MTEEEIVDVLPSITVARLFYVYGRLDDLLNAGFETADDGFYRDVLGAALTPFRIFISYDYNEIFRCDQVVFRFQGHDEYYRLCRAHSRLCGVKLKDNPYARRPAVCRVRHGPGRLLWICVDATPGSTISGQRHRVPASTRISMGSSTCWRRCCPSRIGTNAILNRCAKP